LLSDSTRSAIEERIQRNEYSSVNFRRLTSSSTTTSSSKLTATATICVRSVTGKLDFAPEGHDDDGEHDAGAGGSHAAGGERRGASQPESRPNGHLDDAQGVAAEKEPELRFRVARRMMLGQHPYRPGTDGAEP